jgi:hypothetical protein
VPQLICADARRQSSVVNQGGDALSEAVRGDLGKAEVRADDPSAASQWPDARRGVGPLTGAREPIYRITDPLSRGHCDVGPGVVAISAWIP